MTADIPRLFDRKLYLARQQKASGAVKELHARVAEDLGDRLSILTRQFEKALVIAPQGSELGKVVEASGKLGSVTTVSPAAEDELLLAPDNYNAIFSLLDLHTINDVPGHLAQLSRALTPDGLLMLCFFGGDTLSELRLAWLSAETEKTGGASMRVAPMISLQAFGALLQRAGLALPVTDLDRITLRYADAFALMREVKTLGFSNPLADRSRKFATRDLLMAVAAQYHSTYADPDNRIRATIEIAWANAWKPHASQPQPLKPGSAKARLADALKVGEKKL